MSERFVNVQPWATANTKVAYPFCPDSSTELVTGDDLRAVFADAVILHTVDNTAMLDIELGVMDYDGSGDWASNPFAVALTWSDDAPFFDTGTPPAGLITKTLEWGPWIVAEWAHLGSDPVFLVRFVLSKAALEQTTFPKVPLPRMPFVQRCLENRRGQLQTASVQNPPFPVEAALAGPIVFRAGYNVNIAVEEGQAQDIVSIGASAGLRRCCRVEVAAVAGAGSGRYQQSCDDADAALRTINGIGPDDRGVFHLQTGGGCYWLSRGVTLYEEMVPGYLLFSNACGVCCACEDYVNAYNILRRAADKLHTAAGYIPEIREEYEQAVTTVRTQAICVEGVHIYLRLYAKAGWTIGVQVLLVNNTRCTRTDIDIDVEHDTAMAYEMVEGSAWVYTPGAKKEQVNVTAAGEFRARRAVVPGSAVVLEYELYFLQGGGRVDGALVEFTVTGALNGEEDTASFAVQLRKSMQRRSVDP